MKCYLSAIPLMLCLNAAAAADDEFDPPHDYPDQECREKAPRRTVLTVSLLPDGPGNYRLDIQPGNVADATQHLVCAVQNHQSVKWRAGQNVQGISLEFFSDKDKSLPACPATNHGQCNRLSDFHRQQKLKVKALEGGAQMELFYYNIRLQSDKCSDGTGECVFDPKMKIVL